MKIRYKFGVWMLCLMFPALVWAENAKSICTSFTQQGRQVIFHLADSAALQLQLCSPSVVRIWFSPDGKLQRRNASFAVINEELCLSCGMCAVKCPRHVIYDLRGIYTEIK